jgi:hypothetical protein
VSCVDAWLHNTLDNFNIELTAWPNPFLDKTTVQVKFSEDIEGTIDVYNMLGSKITTLGTGRFEGKRTHSFDFKPDPSWNQATYIVLVLTEKGTTQFRIINIK